MVLELKEIRKLLLCPYSGQLMKDAVIINCTGETYSYQGLKSWWGECVAEGKRTTCPKTNTEIPSPCKDHCVENYLVQNLASVFMRCETQNQPQNEEVGDTEVLGAVEGLHESPSVSLAAEQPTETAPQRTTPDDTSTNSTETTILVFDESLSGGPIDSHEQRTYVMRVEHASEGDSALSEERAAEHVSEMAADCVVETEATPVSYALNAIDIASPLEQHSHNDISHSQGFQQPSTELGDEEETEEDEEPCTALNLLDQEDGQRANHRLDCQVSCHDAYCSIQYSACSPAEINMVELFEARQYMARVCNSIILFTGLVV